MGFCGKVKNSCLSVLSVISLWRNRLEICSEWQSCLRWAKTEVEYFRLLETTSVSKLAEQFIQTLFYNLSCFHRFCIMELFKKKFDGAPAGILQAAINMLQLAAAAASICFCILIHIMSMKYKIYTDIQV